MSAKVRIYGYEASISGLKWTCSNKPLEELLNSMREPLGPSGADPDPDYTAAMRAIEELGGELLEHKPLPSEGDLIY